jgi:hypothetical protein
MNNFKASLSYNKNTSENNVNPVITNNVVISNSSDNEKAVPLVPIIENSSSSISATAPSFLSYPTMTSSTATTNTTLITPDEQTITEFEHQLLQILVGLLGSDFKMIKQVIEPDKKIMLTKADLITLITLLTGTPKVVINSSVPSNCCLKSAEIYEDVESIIVDGLDFTIGYNRLATLVSSYQISLERIIPDTTLGETIMKNINNFQK